MPKIEVYEPTTLQQYVYCAEKFRLRYIEGIAMASGTGALIRGLIGHQILSNPGEDMNEVMDAAFTNYKNGVLLPKIEVTPEDEREIRDELRVSIQNWYAWATRRQIEVLETEKTIEFTLNGHPIRGTVDLIFRYPNTREGAVVIGDFKFGKRPADRQLDRSLQHGLYYYGMRALGYEVDHNVWIQMMDLIPYKVNGKHGMKGEYRGNVMYPILISDRDRPYIERIATDAIKGIEGGHFPQASYGVQAPCAMCEYAEKHCPRFKTGRRYQHDTDMIAINQSLKEEELKRSITWPTK